MREQRKSKGQDRLEGRRRCRSQQRKVSAQMDREGATSGSWRIFFRSSSITSRRRKCNYGHGSTQRRRRSQNPSLFFPHT